MSQPGEKEHQQGTIRSNPCNGYGFAMRKFASRVKNFNSFCLYAGQVSSFMALSLQKIKGCRSSPTQVEGATRLNATAAWKSAAKSFMEKLKEDDLAASYYVEREWAAGKPPTLQILHLATRARLPTLVSRAQAVLFVSGKLVVLNNKSVVPQAYVSSTGNSTNHYLTLPLDGFDPKEAAALRLILHLCDLEERYHPFLNKLTKRLCEELSVEVTTTDGSLIDMGLLSEDTLHLLNALRTFIDADNFEPLWEGFEIVGTVFELMN